MFRSYFTIAFRTFSRQKVYTFINIGGLAIGLAGTILILGYILDELSYDEVHPYTQNTYRIGTHGIFEDGNEGKWAVAPALWSSHLKENYPDVQAILRTLWFGYPTSINYKDKDKILLTEELDFVDKCYGDVLNFDVIVTDKDYQWSELNVDYDFPDVFNLELLIGRDFMLENPADSDACLINEAAIKNLGIEIQEALGLRIEDSRSKTISTVIGVVKDFPYRSMHQSIGPLRIIARPHHTNHIVYVKLPGKNRQLYIQKLESKWREIFPGIGFDYWFLDDEFNRMYDSEIRMAGLSESFSVVAIIIACLGLLGLASYVTEQKTHEIGVRKVLGASVNRILLLFLSIFLKMLLISALVAGPVAFFLMNKWLQQFVYRISIDWKILLSAIGILFGVTLLTVGYELIRASIANPVNAIRHE